MNRLEKEKWINFKTDGRLFEELIQDLLPLEYPGHEFQRTPHSHDGARDIISNVPLLNGAQARIWVECKYHGERLPAHAISMTMVMALLDNAQQIIFFSYSPVNRAFIQYVSRFQSKTGIHVQICDDCVLEDLIIRHWANLDTKKYFNEERPPAAAVPRESVEVHMEVLKSGMAPHMEESLGQDQGRAKTSYFYLNDVLEVRFSLRNLDSSRKIAVHLCMDPPKNEPFFEALDRSFRKTYCQTIHLPPYSVRQVTLPFKLVRYRDTVSLPKFALHYDGTRRDLPGKRISCRWIAETPLIGQSYFDMTHQAEKFLFSRSRLGWLTVAGPSGVGKSRLLKEFSNHVEGNGIRLISLNAERRQLRFGTLIQTMTSILTGLPNELRGQVALVIDSSTVRQGNSYAARILYDSAFDLQEEFHNLLAYGCALLKAAPAVLMIDNAQNCDEQTLNYLSELLDNSENCVCGSSVILSFNRDMVFPGTPAWSLLHRLSALSAQSPRDVSFFSVQGFTREDARHYLNECLTWPKQEHIHIPETLELLLDNCGTQPFYLQNMILCLVQKGILSRTDTTSFYVHDIQGFHQEIKALPKNLENLLRQREELLLEQLSADPQNLERYRNLAQLMSAVQRLPDTVYRDIIGEYQLLDDLISLGILQQEDDDWITFRHQLIQRYYLRRYPLRKAPSELLRSIAASVRQRGLLDIMGQPVFLIQHALGQIDRDVLETTLQQMLDGQLDFVFARSLVPALFRNMERAEWISGRTAVKVYQNSCRSLAGQFGLEASFSSYSLARQHIMSAPNKFLPVYESAYQLLREYENALLNAGTQSGAEALLEDIQTLLDRVPEADPGLLRCRAQFAIGKCVAYNALNQFERGREAAEEALNAAKELDDLVLSIQAHLEYGYLYYYSRDAVRFREEIYTQWHMAYEQLRREYLPRLPKSKWAKDHLVDAVFMTGMLADLTKEDYDAAAGKARTILELLDQTNMPFYEAKMRLALSAYFLMETCRDSCVLDGGSSGKIIEMLHQSIDKCIAYCLMRDYPICFHLLATVQHLSGQGPQAVDNYRKAMRLAWEYAQNAHQELQWEYLFLDAAYRLRQRGLTSEKVFDQLQNETLKAECGQILAARGADLQDRPVPQLSPLYISGLAVNVAKA